MEEKAVSTGYRPRWYQRDIHAGLRRFSVLVLHRRAGKTVLAINALIDAALRCEKPNPRFAYLAPYQKQAKQIAWDTLRTYSRPIPGTRAQDGELQVTLPNGARIRLYGADNPDALRGLYFDGVVLDEVADMRPETWGEVIRPALSDRQGWCLFIGTPKGLDLFHDLYHHAVTGTDPAWYGALYTADDTGAIPAGELELARRSMSDAQYRQEFLCDWQAASDNVLIPLDLVAAAMRRHLNPAEVAELPVVLGVDVARYGGDRSSLCLRQGLWCREVQAYQGLDNMTLAARVAVKIAESGADAVFVDAGRGEGVIDRLRQLGHSVVEVNFGGRPTSPRYLNKRAEMWDAVAAWLRAGGALPADNALRRDLSTPTYDFDAANRLRLESKDALRERGLPSPDLGDALALTFALPVQSRNGPASSRPRLALGLDYNPYEEAI